MRPGSDRERDCALSLPVPPDRLTTPLRTAVVRVGKKIAGQGGNLALFLDELNRGRPSAD